MSLFAELRQYSGKQTVKTQELGDKALPEDKQHISGLECYFHSRAVTHGTTDADYALCNETGLVVTNAVEFNVCLPAGEYIRWSEPKWKHEKVVIVFTGSSIESTYEQALAWAEKFEDKENNAERPARKILVLSPIKREPSYSEVK